MEPTSAQMVAVSYYGSLTAIDPKTGYATFADGTVVDRSGFVIDPATGQQLQYNYDTGQMELFS